MDLYYSTTSPYARLVRVAVREKGLDGRVTPHLVDPWADDADLMRVNPLVRVPALVTDDAKH
jgi:glutathione S-transferase